MQGICTLAEDINRCPHYNREKAACNDGPEVCGFFSLEGEESKEQGYIREPRWYEQYMK